MNKPLTAVAWVISPINVLQCLIAHKKMQEYIGADIKLHILHYYPSTNTAMTSALFTVVEKLTRNVDSFMPCHAVSYESGLSSEAIPKGYLPEHADFIFIAHDVVSAFFQNLQCIYPAAKSVCYGDALGQFFQREVHLGFLQQGNTGLNAVKDKIRSLFGKPIACHKSPPKDFAVLTIPVSQASLPAQTKLLVPERKTALDIIEHCAKNDADLLQYCHRITGEIAAHGINSYIFMTENMSEGGFISPEKETEMYVETIRQYCPNGSLIYIKPHPGEQKDSTSLLRNALGDNYIIRKFSEDFKRYPVELFRAILDKCTIICMFYPALSLKYLYDMDVIQPMDDTLIDRYFEERFRKSYKNAISLNMIPLRNLDKWDGKGLLYNGR